MYTCTPRRRSTRRPGDARAPRRRRDGGTTARRDGHSNSALASIQDERSQHKNKAKALKLISARVRDKEREEERRKHGEARSSLLGGGDRSERIRTYNYPQDRVTDHRCKHTTHGISKLLDAGSEDGLVATFYPFLQNMVYDEQIAALEDEEQIV